MLWRHLRLVRAWSAAGLITCLSLNATPARSAEPSDPLPGVESRAETVKILDAEKSGRLVVDLRGNGQGAVKMSLRNTTPGRLNVVLPAGLVASSTVGQAGGAGGGAGGGGLQNMGLGAPANRPGAFGQFNGNGPNAVGFRSVGLAPEAVAGVVAVAAGKSVELDLAAVCLNFGLPSPTKKDKLTLIDVDDYSHDPRVRRALRSLATLGTSQGTAQAAMWSVCNNVAFEAMLAQGEKVVNRHEVALAARFVQALDGSSGTDLVDPAYLSEARIFVTVLSDPYLEKDARRISVEMEGLRILGLPARVSAARELPTTVGPAMHLQITLTGSKVGETTAKLAVRYASGIGSVSEWVTLGHAGIRETSEVTALKGVDFARAVDRAVASVFVSAKPARKTVGATTLKIENRLPFSLASVTLKAGLSSGSPSVTLSGLGIGPARSGIASIQSPVGVVEHVELNGL